MTMSAVLEPASGSFFEDAWVAHAHNPVDPDWRHVSYKLLGPPISDIDGFWVWWNSVESAVDRSMVFVMREGIHPSWDDPANLDGSIASVMVPVAQAVAVFREFVQLALGESLIRPGPQEGGWLDLNGVSIGPKRGFCVVKIWMRTLELDGARIKLPSTVDAARVRVQPCRAHMTACR